MVVMVLAVVLYVGLYTLLSIPAVQQNLKEKISAEVSIILGGKVEIDNLSVRPFSEVLLKDVAVFSPEGEKCISISKVAAGIDLWQLLVNREIVFNYAQLGRMDANISQTEKDSPLNIQFLIDALSPKDKTKPPTLFNLRFRNIVVRNSSLSFSRPWLTGPDSLPSLLSDIRLSDLRLDLSIPVLRNDLFRFAVRNLQCNLFPGPSINSFSGDIAYFKDLNNSKNDRIELVNLKLALPATSLEISDLSFSPANPLPFQAAINGFITPADFKAYLPELSYFDSKWTTEISAEVDKNSISIPAVRLEEKSSGSFLSLSGYVNGFSNPDSLKIGNFDINANVSATVIEKSLKAFPFKSEKVRNALVALGSIDVDLNGELTPFGKSRIEGEINSAAGYLELRAEAEALRSKRPFIKASLLTENLRAGNIFSLPLLGEVSLSMEGHIHGLDRNAEGDVAISVDQLDVNSQKFSGIEVYAKKQSDDITFDLSSQDGDLPLLMHADCHLSGEESTFDVDMEIDGLNPANFGAKGKLMNSDLSGSVKLFACGNNADNLTGFLKISDFNLDSSDGRSLPLRNLSMSIDRLPSDSVIHSKGLVSRSFCLKSDWLDADISGIVSPNTLPGEIKYLVAKILPALVADNPIRRQVTAVNSFTYSMTIKSESPLFDFFNTPIRPLSDIPISGIVDSHQEKATLFLSTPYLQQGKNKLIRNVAISFNIEGYQPISTSNIDINAILPVKNGEMHTVASISAHNNSLAANFLINPENKKAAHGSVALEASFSRIPDPFNNKGQLAVHVDFNPTEFELNESVWKLAAGSLDYSRKKIGIRNFLVSNGSQYVKIEGRASDSDEESIRVKLNDIDLGYVFSILNINYVSFGGMASGEVVGKALLSKSPKAYTNFLNVKGLEYNGAILGDGALASDYDATEKKVAIYAVIRDPLTRSLNATVDGGIWVTRDSLSFDFDANKLNVKFLKPYMAAFCSDINGMATGKCKLFGTFKDIDLTGDVVADTLSMKLDFTNTWYHVSNDVVNLKNGLIEIPPLTLYDDFGNKADLSGYVRHEFFHNPSFNFRVKNAQSLLVYDTNESVNPLWYGTIYGSGNVLINGKPGLIDIDINMTTNRGSRFWYVISDSEEVEHSSFLTFTDKRKMQTEAGKPDTIPAYLHKFMKARSAEDDFSSNVILSMKGTVTNDAVVTLIMDPKGGDKITATGSGALQMDYNMHANDFRMIGTYVLDQGSYNFTLQDIIIKNFVIKKGSQIKFDGDPMNANLDIAATYRVNTNLTDLDKSFANDKELNRTNVPVDALLLVNGPLTHPDINFDIELPSVSSDVERKVKSIVSTNDMMNRQIIYLLALNRFYTPEYTSGYGGNNGSEFSSMASSTISSQLSNILSQMTDKLSVAPSFRSDKGDFSDMEFDLALSSRLLNNRLLVNGNFGYRDRNTSNTQFIGDFDLEYLLNPNGNLRLKAYNHFNDQNYYLRSALTTQGVGVVFTKDFDHLFGWKRRKRGSLTSPAPEAIPDTVNMKPETN